jgi:nucleoid-associated protein YgaU
MNGSTRAGIAAVLLVVVWIVVYWRTTPPPSDDARVVGGTLASPGFAARNPVVEAPPQPSPTAPLPDTIPNTPSTVPLRQEASPSPDASLVAQGIINRAAQPMANTPSGPAVPPAKPAPKPGETIPPTFDMYEVQKGDNAQVISQKKYGTTKHWRAVLKANPLLDFTRLKPGKVIKVPHDPDNTQGVVVESPAAESEFVEYTVASGDTLIGIAQALYGKSSMWQDIRAANPALDEDGSNLKPGMKLKVPPPTKGASSSR